MSKRNSQDFQTLLVSGLAAIILATSGLVGQSAVRSWGGQWSDTDAREGAFIHVDASTYSSAVVREDGRIITYGAVTAFWGESFSLPAGLRYQKVAMGQYFTLGLLSDGTVAAVGRLDFAGTPVVVPALPPGVRYVDIEVSLVHALLLRSDGAVVGFGLNNHGQLTFPTIPPGTQSIALATGSGHSALLLRDGSVLAFGSNSYGQCNVPPLPPGLSYVQISAYSDTTAAVRSDGALLVWGSNSFGQCNVPPGSYERVAGGGTHTVAWRTDGSFIACGDNYFGQLNSPSVGAGVMCKRIACGSQHTIALMSDGSVLSWGNDVWQQVSVPVPPPDPITGARARFVSAASGGIYSACILSDGTLRIWGDPYLSSLPLPFVNQNFKRIELGYGMASALRGDGTLVSWGGAGSGSRTAVPPLPPGMTYIDFDDCTHHTVAIRSDGNVVRYGNFYNPIPPLPPGQRYVAADAEQLGVILLRSDGTVHCVTCGSASTNIPPAGPGLQYVKVALANGFAAAIRSDGTLALWGGVTATPWVDSSVWRALPPLPPGVVYVEISGGDSHMAARRSDGEVVVGGRTTAYLEHMVPPLQPGTSYVEVDGGDRAVVGRVGPTSTYISFYPGCGGSRPAARLVPADTPRIGATIEVRIFDLPNDLAFVALGFTRTAPVALDFAGMPGCTAHITADAIDFAIGQTGNATVSVAIPNRQSLVGLHFFHQALVLDPAAGNVAGAVVSAAAEAVIGHW